MKPKYYSLIVILFASAVVGVLSWYGVFHYNPGDGKPSFRPIKPLSEIKVPSKSVLEEMDRIERSMHLLSAPSPQLLRRVDLSALGYVAVSPTGRAGTAHGISGDLVSEHRLTMAFEGRAKRYCVIDSKLYPEGAVLPDGATIVKIESRRVLVAKESMQQWLEIDPLLGIAASEKSS